MEAQEQAMVSTHIIKGKRTKRQRPTSPHALTTVDGGDSGGGSDNSGGFNPITPSPTNSIGFTESTEEEDMANCLILLAQGTRTQQFSAQLAATTTKSAAAGLYIYECKTCNRCFPSFQALGGHRASHKRPPKSTIEDKNQRQLSEDCTTLSLQISNTNRILSSSSSSSTTGNNKSRVHECSICGSEFTSGQALGGHMRRHRTTMTSPMAMTIPDHDESQEAKKPRNVLSLDLNLPAPEDDRREPKLISFGFSAISPLVDCHY